MWYVNKCWVVILLSRAWFQVGMSGLAVSLDKKLDPRPYPYNLYYFRGNRQFAAGIHYRFRWHQFNVFGETAGVSDFKYPAVLTGVTCTPVSRVKFALLTVLSTGTQCLLLVNLLRVPEPAMSKDFIWEWKFCLSNIGN